MDKPRMGRPPKDKADQQSEIVAIRLTPAERAEYEKCAERGELTLSAWIRDKLAKAAKREAKDA